MSDTHTTESTRIAFVCVRNAGRSQMAAAFAERERERRDLDDHVEILSGGTHPGEAVHDVVIETMSEVGIDVSDRTPREIADAELRTCDHVATIGCSTLDLGGVDVHDWALDDPGEADIDRVRRIRDEVERRVAVLFDDLDAERA